MAGVILPVNAALLISTSLAFGPDPQSLAIPPGESAKAKELIGKLGSSDFHRREQAAAELKRMGRLAFPALEETVRSSTDHETLLYAGRLLPHAALADFSARAACFLADTDGRYVHQLPGLSTIRTAAGDNKRARSLYTDALASPEARAVLAFTRLPPEVAERALASESKALARRVSPKGPAIPVSVPELAAFLAADCEVSDEDTGPDYIPWRSLVPYSLTPSVNSSIREAVAGKSKYGDAIPKLVRLWVDTRKSETGLGAAQSFANGYGLGRDVVLGCAARMLKAKRVSTAAKFSSIEELAATEDRRYLPLITRQFDDASALPAPQLHRNRLPVLPEVQVRDYALAVAVVMTGQDPKEYGFDVTDTGRRHKYWSAKYRFTTDAAGKAADKRATAFKKWKEWEEKQARHRE